jgi:hypothetical protein
MRNLWFISAEGRLEVMRVQAGISDGASTEIITGENIEGMRFIVREKI